MRSRPPWGSRHEVPQGHGQLHRRVRPVRASGADLWAHLMSQNFDGHFPGFHNIAAKVAEAARLAAEAEAAKAVKDKTEEETNE
jgi:hypothetical protein